MIKIAVIYVKDIDRNKYQSNEEYQQACAANAEAALKRFKRKVEAEGILKDYRDRMYYKSKGERQREKAKAGRRKQLRQMYKQRALDKKFD